MKRYLIAAILGIVSFGAVSVALAATPTCAQGTPGVAPAATLTFTPPTLNTDGTPVATPLTYNLYMSTASGAETKVASALAGSPINVSTGLKANTTFFFQITAVDKNGVESAPSNEVCKAFPASTPSAVVITIT